MALIGSVTGSVNLGGASTFISSSNGSSVEIGSATQVLIMSGGGATSTNPRNLSDINFFVSGTLGSAGSATRGTSLLGGDAVISGSLTFGGDATFTNATSRLVNSGQYAYWQNWYPTNPVINLSGKFGAPLIMFQVVANDVGFSGKLRLGSATVTGTARLHITASSGAASTAPIKIDSGTLLATPEAGAIEYDATRLYLTDGNSVRRNVLMTGDVSGSAFNDSFSRLATTASVSFAGNQGASYFASSSVGSDVFFFVSGTTSGKDQANTGKVAVFGGDVIVSGNIFGGASFGTNTTLTLRSSKVQVTGNALGFGQSGGNDVNFFTSGSVGSKNGATPGTALFGGDVVVSGTLYNANGVAFSAGGAATGTFNDVSAGLVTTASVSFAGTQGATYFASRSIGQSTGADVFFYVSGTARYGHNPAQGFLAKRTLFNGDVVTSGTLQLLGAGNTLTIGSDTLMFVSGTPGSKGTSFSRGTTVFAGDLLTSGAMHLGTTVETMGLTSSIGAGVTSFDVTQQSIFYLSGTTSDFTANFINVPTISGRVVSVNLLVTQSATAYKPTAVQIGGAAQTLLWANGVTPTANANKQDVFGFSLVRSGTNWAVLGQMSTYG